MLGEIGFDSHIQQLGLAILTGIIIGIAFPPTAGRRLFPTILVIAGGLALLHGLILRSQVGILYLMTNWGGSSLGLLIISGLCRSWTAMYDKHLVAWGAATKGPTDQDA